MALGRRQYARRLPTALAQMTIGGPCHETASALGFLHDRQHFVEGLWGTGEHVAHGDEVAGARMPGTDDMEDDAGDQRLGLLVPVRLAGLARRIVDQSVGQQGGVLGQLQTVRIETVQRIEGGGRHTRHPERVQHIDRPEAAPRPHGDPRILTLGVNAEDRAVGGQQIGNNGADALARPGGRDGDQMLLPVIAQERTVPAVLPPDDQAFTAAERGPHLPLARPPGRAMHVSGVFEARARRPAFEPGDESSRQSRREQKPVLLSLIGVPDQNERDDEDQANDRAHQVAADQCDDQPDESEEPAQHSSAPIRSCLAATPRRSRRSDRGTVRRRRRG